MTAAPVVVIGAGPAGLSAATELRRLGVARVLVLDREPEPGGIPRFCGHSPFGLREFRRLLRGPSYARRLTAAARAAGVEIRTRATVIAIRPGPVLEISTPEGLIEIAASRVILATGCREMSRVPRAIGGTKPAGIVTAGTLQAMAYGSGLRPFRAPVIFGSELVAFSALLTAAHLGARVVAMVEPAARATARFPAALLPRLKGVPLWTGTDVIAVEGRERVEAVLIRNATTERRIVCDGLITTGLFRPDAIAARDSGLSMDARTGGPSVDGWARTSDPTVFAAGNVLRGVETAGWCWDEGRRVANAVARDLQGDLPAPAPALILEEGLLAWAMPQAPVAGGALGLQLRLARQARGRVVATGASGQSVSFFVNTLPERRIAIDAAQLPEGPVTLRFEEERP